MVMAAVYSVNLARDRHRSILRPACKSPTPPPWLYAIVVLDENHPNLKIKRSKIESAAAPQVDAGYAGTSPVLWA